MNKIYNKIEQLAEKIGDCTAVIGVKHNFTYRQLVEEIDKKADFLQKNGIGSDSVPAVYMQRSEELLFTLLALMKIEAAYVPIDIGYPQERMVKITEIASCDVLITDNGITSLNRKAGVYENAAYILFTSGSSGTPKGVVTKRNALICLLEGCQDKIPILQGEKVLFKTPINFAFSVYEIFWPLVNGGIIVILESNAEKSTSVLSEYICRYGIDVLTVVPAVLKTLVAENNAVGIFGNVKKILCAGEVLPKSFAEDFLSKFNSELFNIYGMTETTGYIFAYDCRNKTEEDTIPVGTPINCITYKILNEDKEEVPEGIIGELYLHESPVLNGYCSDLEDRFTKTASGEKMWCTGDLVRFCGGELYYCGRNDNMVKIHGNRVELEEIENHAERLDFVNAAIAGVSDEGRLLLFVETEADDESSEFEIRRFFKENLPLYMIPSKVYLTDKILRLPNGKKDRKGQLCDFEEKSAEKNINTGFNKKLTNIQKFLSGIYGEIIGGSVETNIDFFELGGDSFGMTIALESIYEVCGVSISTSEFIASSSIEAVEEIILEKRKENRNEEITSFSAESCYDMTDIQLSYLFDRIYSQKGTILPTSGYKELRCSDFDTEKFQRVICKIVKRHDVLRTVFDNRGKQTVLAEAEVDFNEITLNGCDKDKIDYCRRKLISETFDYKKAPLFKINILHLSDKEAIVQMYFDALIVDGYSVEIIIDEINTLYEDINNLSDSCDVKYGGYVEYLKQCKSSKTYNKDKEFWKERRKNLPANIELPVKKAEGSISGAHTHIEISYDKWSKIQSIAKKKGVTGFVTALTVVGTAFKILTKENEFLISLPESLRPENGKFGRTVGVFSNFMFFAFDGKTQKFSDKLKENQKQLLSIKQHHLFSGTENLRELGKESGELGSDIIPIVFTSLIFENDSGERAFKKVYSESHSSNIPIEIILEKVDGNVWISFNYVKELFEESLFEQLKNNVGNIFDMLSENEEIWDTVIKASVSEREREIWESVNNTYTDLRYENIGSVIERNFKEYGDKIAVENEIRALSYSETEKKIFDFCNALCMYVTDEKKPICIFLKKSFEQIFAVIACVYLGVPYMPIEEDIPIQRLKLCVENSGCETIFCNAERKEKLKGVCRNIIAVEEISVSDREFRPVPADVNDLIAVIHTSGSTGTPKAVMVPYGGLFNNLMYIVKKYDIGSDDAVIALTNLAHDMSMFDIFGMLMTGGKIVVPTHEKRKDPLHWLEIIKKGRVTTWNSVPAMMEMFMTSINYNSITLNFPMKLFLHGGDYVKPCIPKFLYESFPMCKVVSVGGPTETTLWNICHEITEEDINNGIIPYGRPIPNNRYYLLDKNLDPVAFGVMGYMYADGIGLSKGYLGDTKRTEEKFIYHCAYGVRIYNTGDLGRYLPNGEIDFMGREDFQIKINGKRIETEEISGVISKCKDVDSSFVVGDIENKRIAAFYISDRIIDREIFKNLITEYLPDYMMPSVFIRIEKYPLTANGKVNRHKLIEISREYSETEAAAAKDLSEDELEMKELYDSFVENNSYSPEDSFLIAGGNSLKAIQFIYAIKQKYSVDLGMVDFFSNSSLRELTKFVKKLRLESNNEEENESDEDNNVLSNDSSKWDPFPLSELQQAYLVGRKSQMSLDVVTHGYLEVDCQDYDHEKFLRVINILIKRHDALRCVVSYDGTQRFEKKVPDFEIPVKDLSGYSKRTQDKYIRYVREIMIRYKLNLDEIPLVRIHVNLLEEKHAVIQIYFDILIIDGVSYKVLYNELEMLYDDENSVLAPLNVTFKDYIQFKERQKTTKEYAKAKKYWQKRIENLPEPVTLPLLCNPEEINNVHGIVKECKISMASWLKIKEMAERRGITGFAVLFTAFSEVIARWNNSKRFLLSIPKADRPRFHEDINNMVGECATFLLFEVESRPEETFEETCVRNQRQIWEANENSAFTGVEVLREIYKHRNYYGNALVPVVFSTLIDIPQGRRKHFKTKYYETLTSQVWIDIDAQICNDEMQFNWNVPEGLFDEEMLDDMVTMQMDLLNRVAKNSSQWLVRQELPLPERDKRIINNITVDEMEISEESIQEKTELSFKKWRDNVFAVVEEEVYTYSQTESYIRRKVSELKAAGVKKGDHIAVVLGKSFEQIVCTLAVICVGAVYVPFEEDCPQKRLEYCIKNTDCKFIFADRTINAENINAVFLSSKLKSDGEKAEFTFGTDNDILTIIHTSGSTGNPKAVMVRQGGIKNSVEYTLKRFGINETDSVLALTNLSHDMSMFDLFGMLFSGGKIVMLKEAHTKDPIYWIKYLLNERITTWNSVPAMLQMLNQVMKQNGVERLESIKRVFTGGDYVSVPLMNDLKKAMPNAELVSVGGPTETTLWNIYHVITDEDLMRDKIPYGRPIANNRYTIRDENLRIAPVGVIGLMYCTGVGVTAGYYNDNESTARKYLKDENGAVMYCTGDLGMYLPNGEIEFMGRNDLQVKINGKRIELSEIEYALNQYADIEDAVAKISPDGKQIWAYYISKYEIDESELKESLLESLPIYMIPKYFVRMEAFPLSRTDKIARDLLPEPNRSSTIGDNSVMSAEAEKLLDIAGDVLGNKDISINDNFFLSGGDSLLAIMFCKKIENAFGIAYGLSELFSAPEFRAVLTKIVEYNGSDKSENVVIKRYSSDSSIKAADDVEYVGKISYSQEGIWLYEMFNDNNLFTLTGMCDIEGCLDEEVFVKALEKTVEKYDVLRMSFDTDDDYEPILIVHKNKQLNFIRKDILPEELEEELEKLKMLRISVEDDSLSVFQLWRWGDNRYKFVMSLHHIISDQASFQIIISTLYDFYFKILENKKCVIEEKARYCDYAHWEREHDIVEKSVEYWKPKLQGIGYTNLPGAGRVDYSSQKGLTVNINFTEEEKTSVMEYFSAVNVTKYVGFLTLYAQFLHEVTGDSRIAIGSPVSTRNFYGMDDVMGLFVNETVFISDKMNDIMDAFDENKSNIPETIVNSPIPFEKIASLCDNSLKSIPFHLHFNYIEEKNSYASEQELIFRELDYVKNNMQHNFGLFAEIRGGKLNMQFTYKKDYLDLKLVEEYADKFKKYILDKVLRKEEVNDK